MIHKKMSNCLRLSNLLSVVVTVALVASDGFCQTATADKVDLGKATYEKAEWIFDHATETHYQHLHKPASEQVKIVSPDVCEADADCSGFVSYVLGEIAPRQYERICAEQPNKDYPQAKTFTRFFLSLSDHEKAKGWRGLRNFEDLQPGDIIAWEKPPNPDATKKGNTGHVMIVAERPGEPEFDNVGDQKIRFVAVKVLDCSSVTHFAPETMPPHAQQQHRDGLGKGTVRLILDQSSQPIGYWEGTFSNVSQKEIKHPTYTTDVGFARLEPLD